MRRKLELHWICEARSHYNDYLFSALASSTDLSLKVHYMLGSVDSHPWKVEPKRGYINRTFTKRMGLDLTLLRKAIFKKRSVIFLVGGWFDITAAAVIILCSIKREPFLIWTDTPRDTNRSRQICGMIRKLWLKFVFRSASFVLGTGSGATTVLRQLGCDANKVVNL